MGGGSGAGATFRVILACLVVSLAGRSVRHILGPLLLRDLHLTLGDDRPRQTASIVECGRAVTSNDQAPVNTEGSTLKGGLQDPGG